MISWDWIEGYLAAVRNMEAAPKSGILDSPNAAAWTSAIAAVASAIAAGLSWRVSRNTRKSAMESERVAIYEKLNAILKVFSNNAIKIDKLKDRVIPLTKSILAHDEEFNKYKDRLAQVAGNSHEFSEGISDFLKRIREAKSDASFKAINEEIIGAQALVYTLEYKADTIEVYLDRQEGNRS